jgi:predicted extracellular nuclease
MTKLVAVACLLVGCASAEEALPGGGFDFAAAAGDDFAVAPGDLARRTNGDGGVIGNCPPTQHIVVNELKTGGTAAGASDEFVELYNPCDVDVDLTGWSLVYRSATGTTDVTIVNLARTIASGGFLLVAGPTYSNGGTPDQTYGTGRLAQAGGGVGLRDPTMALVDSVGYGTATNMFVEGAAAAAPANDQSLARIPSGVDSNHNDLDFMVATTPTPRATN